MEEEEDQGLSGSCAPDQLLLRDTLASVLRKLMEPIVLSALTLEPTLHRSELEGFQSFEYQAFAVDPHDLEPLRETLLLEAECGGARRLLPMLADQLAEDGLPEPTRLKVRLES
mmetsp:Transcript_2024/g.5466  ORF Transcript_2024/g.5466 Transcript_2024/m.5466 type:complete len:114 (+) Transcript_2024:2162-2503(+)